MSFDAMSKYNHNEPVEHLWAVAKNGLGPVRKYKVLKEGAKNFVLEDGTMVRKCDMQNAYQLFFTNEDAADATYRGLSKVFDPACATSETNYDRIQNASIPSLSRILFDMIQEICEDGMPTKEEIENWLKSDSEKEHKSSNTDGLRENLMHLNDQVENNKKVEGDRRTALDVAKYIVNMCIAIGHPISNSCLQHVLYELYKAAFRRGVTLFYDEFEASAVGPRISAVYYNFCAWGAWPITMEQKESDNPKKQIPEQFQDLFKVIICATVNTSLYDWIPGAEINREVADTKDVYCEMLKNMQKEGLV